MLVMVEKPKPPPESVLIRDARKRARLSGREAARRAELSEGRWRQIENGYQSVTRGVFAESPGPAETVARMAQVVDLTPEMLEEAGRADAAEELRRLNVARQSDDRRADDLDRRIARMKANPRSRRRLEKILEIVEDCD
jgi:transcriptional regulator with XRE-family HTH domain